MWPAARGALQMKNDHGLGLNKFSYVAFAVSVKKKLRMLKWSTFSVGFRSPFSHLPPDLLHAWTLNDTTEAKQCDVII